MAGALHKPSCRSPLRRAPLGPRLPFAWQAQYTEPPGRAAARVAACWGRGSLSRSRAQYTEPPDELRRAWLPLGPRLPFAWQAQYTEPPGRAAACVAAAGAAACFSRGRRHLSFIPSRTTYHISLITSHLPFSQLTHHLITCHSSFTTHHYTTSHSPLVTVSSHLVTSQLITAPLLKPHSSQLHCSSQLITAPLLTLPLLITSHRSTSQSQLITTHHSSTHHHKPSQLHFSHLTYHITTSHHNLSHPNSSQLHFSRHFSHLTYHITTHHSSTSHTSLLTHSFITAPLLTPHLSHH